MLYSLHIFNLLSVILTCILYINIGNGMVAQFFLGIFQLLFALGITLLYRSNLSRKCKKMINLYWTTVGLIIINILIASVVSKYCFKIPTPYMIFSVFIVPMLTALYFVIVTHNVYFESKKR